MQHYKRYFCLLVLAVVLSGCAATRENPHRTGSAKADQIIETARALIGTPYSWGGTSPETGFDCSGYVRYVFAQNGYTLPRSTVEQTMVGQPITRRGLAPGDIVIFRLPGGGQRGLHTGIYLGDNTFIHSPRRGERVKEENIASDHWTRWYVGARRILPDFMAQMGDWDENPRDLTVVKSSKSKSKSQKGVARSKSKSKSQKAVARNGSGKGKSQKAVTRNGSGKSQKAVAKSEKSRMQKAIERSAQAEKNKALQPVRSVKDSAS